MRSPDLKRWREPATWKEAAYDPGVRAAVFQVLLALAIAFLAYEIVSNTIENLRKQNIASGFGFLSETAGFDISQTPIPYSSKSTYGAAFLVGLANTLIVAFIGIAIATVLGFTIGIARLSPNWLVAKLALSYVELIRNMPLLLQLLVWYVAVLRTLPFPQDALALPGGGFLDVRGLHLPRFSLDSGGGILLAVLALALAGAWWLKRQAGIDREAGQTVPTRAQRVGWGLVIAVPTIAVAIAFAASSVSYPVLGRFNHEGGLSIEPEFLALVIGLSTYTAAFIAEIVRAGLQGVPRGQREAAAALGLSRRQALRLVILPQSLRIIIPPLTNQYLNLTKNSSLAVAIGYPDLVSVFSGTVLNQTGQAVEVILITMAVYLAISLATAAFMNWFNKRTSWAER
ncbi:amino acid ABC transporter permease [Hyphomicrobium nitrativorans NL23]|uniref:Amino acid ABC transporter permease n=1 Tax=Hyphomicrobium nitrativorans NL23 TaxID=1029756 RepID=V5SHA0_9HYPH|nr:ABC transporter permease subunit [Hyphomicrobium nitrativorans]AHB49430.1 amino acid ABC transporter permease [Hyphomicrobium nitrativorans NL23]